MNITNSCFITYIDVFSASNRKTKPTFVNGRTFYSLTYRHSGKISITADGKELISSPDSVTFVPKGVPYTTEVFDDTHITALHFDFIGEGAPHTPTVISAPPERVRTLFLELIKTIDDSSSHLLRLSIIYEILNELNKSNTGAVEGQIHKKISRAKDIIDSRFTDSLLSIDAVADEIGVSATYLRREFKSAYGVSPIKYLKDVRIKKAARLLLESDLTVTLIAKECGYSSTSYFIQDFHKIMGEAPNQYRTKLMATP